MPSDDRATARPIPLGPAGGYVMRNVKELRLRRGLTYKQLSDRLRELGREIPTLGLSRIERGTRRVDADDLVALAIALDVNPSALLLPRDTRPGDEIRLAQEYPVAAVAAWEWSAGNYPIVPPDITWQRIADFEANARPPWHGRSADEWRQEEARRDAELQELQRRAEAAQEALRAERARNGHTQEETLQSAVPEPPVDKPQRPAVITAIVTSSKGVLIGRRNDGKPPWTFIAGENEPLESPADTIVREVKEETGLVVVAGDILGERVHPKTGRHMVYVAARPAGRSLKVIVGDEEELAEVRWASLAEADELLPGMFEPVREHLAREIGE